MRPLPFWTENDMAAHADWRAMVDYLHSQHQSPMAQVDRLLMQRDAKPSQSPQGLLLWPAWQAAHLGVKIVTLFPDNTSKPNVQGVVLLFDAKDGSPVALLDGAALTLWKTAADAALGTDLLARQDANTLLLVGAGALAKPLIQAHLAVRPAISEVRIWNRHPDKAAALAEHLTKLMPVGVTYRCMADLQTASKGASIICCATGSTAPLLYGAWVQPGTHVNLIGGYTPAMRESDDELMRRSRVYVDSRPFTIAHCGDLTQAFESQTLTPEQVLGDLFDLCRQQVPARQDAASITVFKSGGGAHLDLMMAEYFHLRCAAAL